tara:strand:- start:320 stop:1663 length:1344 start_codon:yes stop_codon:yes gene_type:complete
MLITHFCNAFNTVKVNRSVIACDPWVGAGDEIGWISYPLHKNGANILKSIKPNFVYISHLHTDHLDPKTLSKINKNTKIIIKKFLNGRLKKKIFKLGFYNIMECKPWRKYKLNKDISIGIIPQISSNMSGRPEQINYDVDTSIVIQSNITKEVFYNGVDNPLTVNSHKLVKKFITKKFNKKIAVAVLQDGGNGEYPQCFLNVNRNKEKERIINGALLATKEKLKIMKPEAYISPMPNMIMFGKYSKLQKYVPKPTFTQEEKILKNCKYKIHHIAGGGTLAKKNGKWISKKTKHEFIFKNIFKKYSNKKYFYSNDFKNISMQEIDKAFLQSHENYIKKISRLPIKTHWDVDFYIYQNLTINSKGKINFKNSKFLKKYAIEFNKSKSKLLKKNYSKLKCHLDFNLFYGLLIKKYTNWSQPLAGSLILFERKPNIFDPNVVFSLNYLSIY